MQILRCADVLRVKLTTYTVSIFYHCMMAIEVYFIATLCAATVNWMQRKLLIHHTYCLHLRWVMGTNKCKRSSMGKPEELRSQEEQTRPKLRFFPLGEPEGVITLTNVAGISDTRLLSNTKDCRTLECHD